MSTRFMARSLHSQPPMLQTKIYCRGKSAKRNEEHLKGKVVAAENYGFAADY